MSETKLKVGDKIWYIMTKSYSFNRTPVLIESTVSKVGKKYFEIEGLLRYRFFLDTLKHDGGNYSSEYKAYITDLDYYNEVETEKEYEKLKIAFSSSNSGKFTLEQLKKTREILGL